MALPLVRPPDNWQVTQQTLAGRTILVTGATGGLGRATALACTRAGATVILSGRKVRALEKLYDEVAALDLAEPAILPLDLAGASPSDYDTVVDSLERECESLHGVVHAAAHFDGLTPLAMKKPDQWLLDMQVNLTAPFLLTQACMPLLEAAGDSAVVFVLDDPERMQRAHWNGYGVAKAGLQQLAAILHQETEGSKLRVQALLPAPMRSTLRRMAWFGEDSMQLPEPTQNAAGVVYLLSPEGIAARGRLLDLRPPE